MRAQGVLRLVGLAAIFATLRLVAGGYEPAEPLVFTTDQVVVVGVTGRPDLTDADRQVLEATAVDGQIQAQAGVMAIRPRKVGDCAAAGWTTLGAGRRAYVGGLCDPQVAAGRVTDWAARVQAAAVGRGDARLGTLAADANGCVEAVGPGAALAAARPDGTLADYRTVDAFLAAGSTSRCPVTLIDPGEQPDRVIAGLARDPGVTVIVTGIGPAPGSTDPALPVVYRLGTTLPGWLTSASTRREGIVTLTDLTRTLVDFGRPAGSPAPTTVDGSPLALVESDLTPAQIQDRVTSTAALSDAIPVVYLVMVLAGLVLALAGVIGLRLRRWWLPQGVAVFGASLPAAMALTAATGWPRSSAPVTYAGLAVLALTVLLTAAAYGLARLARWPALIGAVALSVAVFTADAALGGPLEPGSLLNSRPVNALRWYGFGNSTFSAYAVAGLTLAGYLGHRALLAGRRTAALVWVAVIGFGMVGCEGWPSMGADFGGVIALVPPVLYLLLRLSGLRLTRLRLAATAGGAALAIAVISLLDWRRGPDRRSHLGNFVQRILDGDAVDVVSRKAAASLGSIIAPYGLLGLVLGLAVWFVILRWGVPAMEHRFSTARITMNAILGVAVLGTLLNDAGIGVWSMVTGVSLFPVVWFWVERLRLPRPLGVGTRPRRRGSRR